MISDIAPHSLVIRLNLEVQGKLDDGRVSGSVKDYKNFRGIINTENREDAKKLMEKVENEIREVIKKYESN